MPATAALRLDFEPGVLRALGSADARLLEQRLRDRIELEKLREQEDIDLAELKAAEAWLTERRDQPVADDIDPGWFVEAAKRAGEKAQEAEAHFRPVITVLKGELAQPADEFEADVQQLLRDGIDVLEGWLAFYRRLSTMLAGQAAGRGASPKVLRARPVEGEVDHEALSREFMARFPKIRAALAE
jgi:hypothetical protein